MSVRIDVIGDNIRRRSSSVTETSKPISFMDTGSLRTENQIYNKNPTGKLCMLSFKFPEIFP